MGQFRLAKGMPLLRGLCGAWTGMVLLFFYLPLGVLFLFSFNDSKLNVLWEGFTLRWYSEVFSNRPLMTALENSLIVAAWSSILSVLLGTAAAWLLYRHRFPGWRSINAFLLIPLAMPEIVMGISMMIFFKTMALDPGYATIIIAHITFSFPFVLLAVRARLAGMDPLLEEAALDLGATPGRAFCSVIFPFLLPSVVAGFLMSFTLSLDELIVTYFVKSPATETLPVKIYGMAKIGLNPQLNVVSVLFIVSITLFLFLGWRMRRWAASIERA